MAGDAVPGVAPDERGPVLRLLTVDGEVFALRRVASGATRPRPATEPNTPRPDQTTSPAPAWVRSALPEPQDPPF